MRVSTEQNQERGGPGRPPRPPQRQCVERCHPDANVSSKPGSLKAESYKRRSAVSLDSLKPSEVRERTGFEDVRELLFFVTVVGGGDLNRMTEKTSYLTWLEEWFFTSR